MTNYLLGKMRRIYFMALPENRKDMKKSRIFFTVGDSASQAIVQLAGGTFVVALMSQVGISDGDIGVLTSLASLAALFQLFTMGIVSKLAKRKFFVCFSVLQKVFLGFIYFIPLFSWNGKLKIFWLIIGYFFAQIWVQIGTPATQDWMASLVPSKLRGRYLSKKDSLATFVTVFIMLIAGLILDHYREVNIYKGFIIIGSMILILVTVNLVSFSRMKEPRVAIINQDGKEMHGHLAKRQKMICEITSKESLKKELFLAFSQPLFCKALILNLLWMSSFYIAAPFNASYQIKELSLPYTFLMTLNFMVNLVRIYITPRIGILGDKFGMGRIFRYSLTGLLIHYFLTAFSTPGNAYVMTTLAALFSALGWSFIGIGLLGVQLEFIEENRRMIQLSLISSIGGVYGFFISFISGHLLNFMQATNFMIGERKIYGQQILNMGGVLMLLITMYYIKFKIENMQPKDKGKRDKNGRTS